MTQAQTASPESKSGAKEGPNFILGLWGVRYQVKDVARSIEFYTQELGFHLDHKALPAFAQVSSGALKLILSGPGASGSRPMPDGKAQEPGGWTRWCSRSRTFPLHIERLKEGGLHFVNQMESGPGGKQILLATPTATRSSCSSLLERANDACDRAPRRSAALSPSAQRPWWSERPRWCVVPSGQIVARMAAEPSMRSGSTLSHAIGASAVALAPALRIVVFSRSFVPALR